MRPCSARMRSETSRSAAGERRRTATPVTRLGRRDERAEDVDVPHRRGALQHREVALEPGAGVDARRRQRHQLAVGLGVELHEHEVPDLDVAVLVLGRAAGRAVLGAEVPEDLASSGRTGRCRPCARSCRRPGAGSARRAGPTTSRQISLGFVVGGVDGDPEALGVEPEHLGVRAPTPTGSPRP